MADEDPPIKHEKLILRGDIASASFLPWIDRHARKLGLAGGIAAHDALRIELDMSGPRELLDAMEMGCSLGPIDVWIETIERIAMPEPAHDGWSAGWTDNLQEQGAI
nr:acylphosphatase [uncultured Gellertiella sp.]